MWYVILRSPKDNSVIGFLESESDGIPIKFQTEESADEAMDGHLFADHYETIKL